MRLHQVRNDREQQALRYEIDMAKEENARIEEEALALLERTEQDGAVSRGLEEEAKACRERAANARQEAEQTTAALRGEIAQRRRELEAIEAGIEAGLLEQYRRISPRRGGIAVVKVQAGACQGCHMQIPPQMCNEIQAGRGIFVCPHCSRILYWSPQGEEEQEEQDTARQGKSNGRSSAGAGGRKVRTPQGRVAANGGPS